MPIADAASVIEAPSRTGRVRLDPPLDRRAARAKAHGRLESELRSIVRDVIGVGESEVSSPAIRAWIDDATDTAVTAACDRSVDELMDALERCFERASGELIECFNDAACRLDAGTD
jgi:hypothetical protein